MMKEFKGTKGLWKLISWQVIQGEGYVVISEAKDSATIVAACIDEPEDANLIAAAPDLLEALQEMVRELERALRVGYERITELGGSCDDPEMMINGYPEISRANQVIAKALGETK